LEKSKKNRWLFLSNKTEFTVLLIYYIQISVDILDSYAKAFMVFRI